MTKNVVGIVLDESGSMGGQEQRVVDGLNEFVADLKDRSKAKLVIDKFDGRGIRSLYDGKLKDAPTFTVDQYQPATSTPLYDAIGAMIEKIKGLNPSGNVVVLIDTDGQENCSQEFTQDTIKHAIKSLEKSGWEFKFIGTGNTDTQAAAVAAQAAPLNVKSASTYTTSHVKRGSTYRIVSSDTASSLAK